MNVPKSDVATVAAGAVATVATIESRFLLAPGLLIIGLFVFQIFEARTCYDRHPPEARENYDWNKVWRKKGGTWMLWVGFLWLDGLAKTVPWIFDRNDLPLLSSPYFFPITTLFTFAAATNEYQRYAQNIKAIQGSTSDDARWAILMFRIFTAGGIQKWIQTRRDEIMPTRLADQITVQDLEAAIRYYKSGGTMEPPEWMSAAAPDHIPTLKELKLLAGPLDKEDSV